MKINIIDKSNWRFNLFVIFKGFMIDVMPITAKILKMFEPIIFPTEISNSFLNTATNVVTISGKLVPMATIVKPIILSETPK